MQWFVGGRNKFLLGFVHSVKLFPIVLQSPASSIRPLVAAATAHDGHLLLLLRLQGQGTLPK